MHQCFHFKGYNAADRISHNVTLNQDIHRILAALKDADQQVSYVFTVLSVV
jgi:hypothetical protein